MNVDKNCCTPVCASLMCSRRISDWEVSFLCCGSSAVCHLGRPSLSRWFSCSLLITDRPCLGTSPSSPLITALGLNCPLDCSAMNTIVASRAGKDLISSLASGLLTIGSRFGGALDEAASMFSNARDTGLTPREFVDSSRRANKLSECRLTHSNCTQRV